METSLIWRFHYFPEGVSFVCIVLVPIQCLIGKLLTHLFILDSLSWTIHLTHQVTPRKVSLKQFWSW